MNITIIGAGSIGLLFAAKLTELGHDIHIISRHQIQSDELSSHGITLYNGIKTNILKVSSSHLLEHGKDRDCYIVTVKQYQLEALIPFLSSLPASVPIIFTQNGMSHLKITETLPQHHIFVSTVEHGAERISDREVRHNGIGNWRIAAVKGQTDVLSSLISSKDHTFPIEFYLDYYPLLADKVIKNIVINSLTALFDVKNGELINNPHLHKLLYSLYQEMMSVFSDLTDPPSFAEIESLCSRTAENSSSMRTDLRLNRPTEVDAIIGFGLQKGRTEGCSLPVTAFIYESILAIEYRKGIRH
ncbi:2-dehydropantoate 2-reductase [Jeotgalibacillus sp. ET6]|uniref:2-dehydropantoate 2-reductase n=1 Tax=Jeotgalibacillus sp. ET6 TaxID=3037260 RepID=UPI0024182528|nr:2-dehydropantoate 2-reductase [Jeotgalibacillus sp. ET6]MDG5470192.1 2-dehydropantoate 2-reductase [Jeotgalibacillus sp. ET6]